MDKDLQGKTAVVTGSGRNNGRAIIHELAAKGANVIINARTNAAEAGRVVEEARELGADAIFVLGDVAQAEVVEEIRVKAEERWGGVDISVSNAAFRPYQRFLDMTLDDWNSQLGQQLTASFLLAKAFVPQMIERRWGRIIHITGPDALTGAVNRANNVASKGALRGLTKALARELGPYGITVNDVAPGVTDHPDAPGSRALSHPVLSEPDEVQRGRDTNDPEWAKRRIANIPVGRAGLPEDIAYAVGFLASPRAAFYTGTLICCFGGMQMVP